MAPIRENCPGALLGQGVHLALVQAGKQFIDQLDCRIVIIAMHDSTVRMDMTGWHSDHDRWYTRSEKVDGTAIRGTTLDR